MNIAVLNLSGNVGKSTLALQLIAPNLENAKVISVESVNTSAANDIDSVQVEEMAASAFKDIYLEMMSGKNQIVLDVGVSNVVGFMSELARFKSFTQEVDLIIVPVVPVKKQMDDTIKTLEWLASRGFSGKKIRVMFNNYRNDGESLESQFAQILGYLHSEPSKAVFEPYIVIDENEIFTTTKRNRKTIAEIAADNTDWRSVRIEAAKNGDMSGVESAMQNQIDKDLADLANEQLKAAWSTIMGGKKK